MNLIRNVTCPETFVSNVGVQKRLRWPISSIESRWSVLNAGRDGRTIFHTVAVYRSRPRHKLFIHETTLNNTLHRRLAGVASLSAQEVNY